jgi:mono/diheme cytochrome c family protein
VNVKKIVLGVLKVLGALLLLAIAGMVLKFYVLSPKLRPAPEVKAPTSPEAIERGRYLVTHVNGCVACHSQIDDTRPGDVYVPGRLGSGRDFGEMEGAPFRLRAKNLTPDKETGLGAWTDGEILRAVREGVSRDGRPLFPQMPYGTFRETMSDDDALAVVAYLRTLAPIKNDVGRTEVKFPISMFARAAPQPLEASPPAPPPASDKLARGQWLLKSALCKECHDGYNARHERIPGKELAGGMKFPLPGGKFAIAPNITSDKATGVGAYSDEDLQRALDEGKGKDGRDLFVMPWSYYKGLTAEDKAALIAALRSVAPVANVVPPSKTK